MVSPAAAASSEAALFWMHLHEPEYLHVLIAPLLGAGMALGALLILAGMTWPKSGASGTGLFLVLVSGAAAFPAIDLGQDAYDRVHDGLGSDPKQWLDVHMARAEHAQYFFYAAAVLAAIALIQAWRARPGSKAWRTAALVCAGLCAALSGWIAHAGAQVRHEEFREGPPPASALWILPSKR